MNKITFIPVGGLANRMRSIASAVSLSQQTDSKLTIIWFRDWALKCHFYKLFDPINLPNITLKEATFTDLLFNDRPRKHNLWFPWIFQQIKFDTCFYEEKVYKLSTANNDIIAAITKNKNIYIASFSRFYEYENTIYTKLFKPCEEILKEINCYVSKFTSNTIGIHIRRTDNIRSITNSTTELFIEKAEEEINKNKNTFFFLATDSEEDKRVMQLKFGDRIICSTRQARRDSIEGIRDAVVDLYTLSQTRKIYGSSGSSFSEMASWIGNVECLVIEKNSI